MQLAFEFSRVKFMAWIFCDCWNKSLNFLDCFGSEGVLGVNINSVGRTKCCLKVVELLLKGIFVYGCTGKRGGGGVREGCLMICLL